MRAAELVFQLEELQLTMDGNTKVSLAPCNEGIMYCLPMFKYEKTDKYGDGHWHTVIGCRAVNITPGSGKVYIRPYCKALDQDVYGDISLDTVATLDIVIEYFHNLAEKIHYKFDHIELVDANGAGIDPDIIVDEDTIIIKF